MPNTTASAARQVPCQTRNPDPTRMLTRMSHYGTSHGTVTSSHDSHVDESLQSRGLVSTVTNPTLMSHGWNKQGPQAGLVPVPQQQANPLRTGSACGVPLLARNQMWGPEQRRRALERAPRPSGHKPGTCCAHIYRPGAQGRSIMGNNVKNWLLLPILTC